MYWSVQGPGGGIFQSNLTFDNSGSCSSSTVDAVNIVSDIAAATGVRSMTLNLEDSFLYFAIGESDLLSISLGEGEIVNYTHSAVILDARSIASYNEYLAVTADSLDFAVFVRIRRQREGVEDLLVVEERGGDEIPDHLYMIREEFQPQPSVYF